MKTSTILKITIPCELFLIGMFEISEKFPDFPVQGFMPLMAIALIISILGIPLLIASFFDGDK